MVASLVVPLGRIFDVDPQNDTRAMSFGISTSSLEFPFYYGNLCTEVYPLMIACILSHTPSVRVVIVIASQKVKL